uniref:SCP domain-containing protein n=1 Tax=Psilocybe cubensis TaxID=181762 RepID=A0A8H7Y167_PSICU
MFSVSILCGFAVILSFVPDLYVQAIFKRGHHLPPTHSIASRNTLRQIDAFLDAHNIVRAEHNATALKWSLDLAQKAESWVDQCRFEHTNGVLSEQPYGENIAAGTGVFPISAAVASFVADKDQYDPANPTYLHFTQVVWKSTTEVGCAVNQCRGIFDPSLGSASLYVCLYNPVGNVIGSAS